MQLTELSVELIEEAEAARRAAKIAAARAARNKRYAAAKAAKGRKLAVIKAAAKSSRKVRVAERRTGREAEARSFQALQAFTCGKPTSAGSPSSRSLGHRAKNKTEDAMTAAARRSERSDTTEPVLVTAALAEKAANLRYDDLSTEARTVAGHCFMDFFGVTLAARHEPLANILAEQIAEDGGTPQATVIGRGTRANIEQAALLNGAMSHALDFDDVNFSLGGHPTVPIAPAVLALAEHRKLDGKRLLEAFAAGFETECRIGRLVGRSHYQRGWHTTATVGAIGAAAAVSNMLRLDAATTAHALGIAATQAAGLKSVFGTMCKPLHPGRAAAIGLQAARLAQRGFTCNPAILDVEQGFTATQSEEPEPESRARGAAGRLPPAADALQVSRGLLPDPFLDRGEQHAAAGIRACRSTRSAR